MTYLLFGIAIAVLALGLSAYSKVGKLEQKLKEKGILEDDWEK